MKTIQIDGGSSTNKGAQLMLHACLHAIVEKYPDAVVFINNDNSDLSQLRKLYKLKILKRQSNLYRKLIIKFRIHAICYKLFPNLAWLFSLKVPAKGVDLLLNIGGFQFGDQWKHNKVTNKNWERYLSKMRSYGSKIIFMPQAFGPFENNNSKEMCEILDKYSDVLIVRDEMSKKYLDQLDIQHCKVVVYPDFTSSVQGCSCEKYASFSGKVCIIPNSKMIAQGTVCESKYLDAIVAMIKFISEKGYTSFLLNHEGHGDFVLCKKIKEKLGEDLQIINGTNAITTKGIIASSYMVISSRFHGVANSLNSAVPCLATSWSHKYKMLFKEYGQNNTILDFNNMPQVFISISNYLDEEKNEEIRIKLLEAVDRVKIVNASMWEYIWNL